MTRGFRNVAFTVLPSSVAFILFGDWIIALLFQRGNFWPEDTLIVHGTLAAYGVGLLAASSVKLFASGFHAMLDTRTPVRYAAVALLSGAAAGAGLMWAFYAPGLALGTALGAWLYLLLLWGGLSGRVGKLFTSADLVYMLKLIVASACGALAGLIVLSGLAPGTATDVPLGTRLWVTATTLASFGVVYLLAARLLGALTTGGLRAWTDRS